MATVRLSLPANSEAAGPAPEKHAPTYAKPLAGEIEDVIQAHQQDKAARPRQWNSWRYVALAADDPDVSCELKKDPAHAVVYAQGELDPAAPWRCRACYATRFKTFCFGLNEAGRRGVRAL